MLVPRFVKELHEPHAALDQPTSQQAIVGERRFARLGPVHFENVLRFAIQIHQFGRARLHAKRHFEGADSRGDFRIARGGQPRLVERPQGVERIALQGIIDAARVREIQDRLGPAAELDSLM